MTSALARPMQTLGEMLRPRRTTLRTHLDLAACRVVLGRIVGPAPMSIGIRGIGSIPLVRTTSPFCGRLDERGFALHSLLDHINSFQSVHRGRWERRADGWTHIEITSAMNRVGLGFLVFWFAALTFLELASLELIPGIVGFEGGPALGSLVIAGFALFGLALFVLGRLESLADDAETLRLLSRLLKCD